MNNTTPETPFLDLQVEIGQQLQAIWCKAAYQFAPELTWTHYPPFYPAQVPIGGLLVLGINPSLNVAHTDLATYSISRQEGVDYFGRLTKFMNRVARQYQRFAEVETAQTTELYKPFSWSHLDVLYVRETNQQLFRQELGRPGVASFLHEQTMLTKNVLQKAAPQVLLVANTFATELMGKNATHDKLHGVWMGLEFTAAIDLQTGTWHSPSLSGNPPVFFTGSLAGSNPRNKEDDARLCWQLARCLWLQASQ